jgi:hypothetical protein
MRSTSSGVIENRFNRDRLTIYLSSGAAYAPPLSPTSMSFRVSFYFNSPSAMNTRDLVDFGCDHIAPLDRQRERKVSLTKSKMPLSVEKKILTALPSMARHPFGDL